MHYSLNILVSSTPLFTLILSRSFLTRLQLLQVKITNLHVSTIVFQTSGKVSGISITVFRLFLVSLLLRLFILSRGSRTSSKHTGDTSTEGVTNGRTNGYTGRSRSHLSEQTWRPRAGLRLCGGCWIVRSRGSGVSRSPLRGSWGGSSLSRH